MPTPQLRKQGNWKGQSCHKGKTRQKKAYPQGESIPITPILDQEATPSSLQAILERQLVARNRKYSEKIKAFAVTLHFYSPSAYSFLRTQFNNLLPHPETIRLWYLVVNGSPGFTGEYFDGIRLKCESEQSKNKKVVVNVVMDEMSIKQFVQYQGGRYHGYVDFSLEVVGDGDYNSEAKHAFVFMAVVMNAHWKVPLSYFLIDGLKAAERANLLTTCLELLYETGAIYNSVTYDGTTVNINTCNVLGSNYNVKVTEINAGKEKIQTEINVPCLQPWFEHRNTKEKVPASVN